MRFKMSGTRASKARKRRLRAGRVLVVGGQSMSWAGGAEVPTGRGAREKVPASYLCGQSLVRAPGLSEAFLPAAAPLSIPRASRMARPLQVALEPALPRTRHPSSLARCTQQMVPLRASQQTLFGAPSSSFTLAGRQELPPASERRGASPFLQYKPSLTPGQSSDTARGRRAQYWPVAG